MSALNVNYDVIDVFNSIRIKSDLFNGTIKNINNNKTIIGSDCEKSLLNLTLDEIQSKCREFSNCAD